MPEEITQWIRQYRSIYGIHHDSGDQTQRLQSSVCKPTDCLRWKETVLRFVRVRGTEMDRKAWEWGFIAQALLERGMLSKGKKGFGFACGKEPLASMFASYGCDIVATDAPPYIMEKTDWESSGQHGNTAEDLYFSDFLDQASFDQHVAFQYVDMKNIPESLEGSADFIWSSCALEHLGSIHDAKDFVYRAMRCLKPGGIAVHTTEINLRSSLETWMHGSTCALRTVDLIEIAEHLLWNGYQVEPLDFRLDGSEYDDTFVRFGPNGEPPTEPHFKVLITRCLLTSFGLIAYKGKENRV